MDFALTDEQAMIAETARDFFTENATRERTREAMAGAGIDRDLWQSFSQELGLSGLLVPEAHGGSGLGLVEFATVAEAAGAQVAALPLPGLAMATAAIVHGGSDTQKGTWLPKLADGSVIAASGMDASLEADGGKLSGTVEMVTYGGIADLFLLSGNDGAWLADAKADGVTIETHVTMDQTRPMATISLDGAAAEALADHAAGMAAADRAGWLTLAAEALGGSQTCLDQTVAYSRERIQFGRPIGSFQAYKHRLADLMVEIEQARSAVYWAAVAIDDDTDDPQIAIHSAKAFCADCYFKCAADMIQLHGGIGFTWEHDAHLFFKRARATQTALMDGNWHREQIAIAILGEAA